MVSSFQFFRIANLNIIVMSQDFRILKYSPARRKSVPEKFFNAIRVGCLNGKYFINIPQQAGDSAVHARVSESTPSQFGTSTSASA